MAVPIGWLTGPMNEHLRDDGADDPGLLQRAREAAIERAAEVAAPVLGRVATVRSGAAEWFEERARRQRRREVLARHRWVRLPAPWKTFVVRARGAFEHFVGTVEAIEDGPLRTELLRVEPRVIEGLDALAEAAASAKALQDRLDELQKLLPERSRFKVLRAPQSEASMQSRDHTRKLADEIADARRQLHVQSLAMVDVATHALDLTVGGELGGRVDRMVDDLVALEQALETVPRRGFRG